MANTPRLTHTHTHTLPHKRQRPDKSPDSQTLYKTKHQQQQEFDRSDDLVLGLLQTADQVSVPIQYIIIIISIIPFPYPTCQTDH